MARHTVPSAQLSFDDYLLASVLPAPKKTVVSSPSTTVPVVETLEEYLAALQEDPAIKTLAHARNYRGKTNYYRFADYAKDKTFLDAVDAFVRRIDKPFDEFEKRRGVIEEKRILLRRKYHRLNIGKESVSLELCNDDRINRALPAVHDAVKKKVAAYAQYYEATRTSDFQTLFYASAIFSGQSDVLSTRRIHEEIVQKYDALSSAQKLQASSLYERGLRAFGIDERE